MEQNTKIKNLKIIFFGTGPLAESALYSLYKNNIIPKYVVTKPDSLVGRKQLLTPPYIKTWCESKIDNGVDIDVLQPDKLKDLPSDSPLLQDYDLAIVASYGKIIPENILSVPKYGFLNIHPSDLPKYRGPSPIESALLAGEKEIVVSLMKLDSEMDHGPILLKKSFEVESLDTAGSIERKSGAMGGEMIIEILEHYIEGNLKPVEQDHSAATYCKFIDKSQAEIKLKDDLEQIKNKWRAFYPWPGLFFFIDHEVKGEVKNIRVKISDFDLLSDSLDTAIKKVIPEGKSEMTFEDFKRGYLK